MRKKILKSLMLTLVSVSMVGTGTGVTTFAAEIEEFSDNLNIATEETDADGEASDTADSTEAIQEKETAEEPEIEMQDPEEESVAVDSGDTFDIDIFSDGEAATEEELPDGGAADLFVIRGTVLEKYNGTGGSVTIPENVTEIGSEAFEGCTDLRTVTCNQKLETIGESAFEDCYGLKTVTFNQGLKTIGKSAFKGCDAIKSITVPGSVTLIDASAFYYCSELTSITLQNGLLEIGDDAFEYSGLTSITIPESVTSMGHGVFADCTDLISVTWKSGITAIEPRTFKDCDSLTNLTLKSEITEIGFSAFEGCTSLTSVSALGGGITEIGSSAFEYCSSLETLALPVSVTRIGSHAFSGCDSLKINIPAKIESIEYKAFEGCEALTTVSLPNTLTHIGGNAFWRSGLTSVTIPASVTEMGENIFMNCGKLTSATVYASTVPGSCFEGCSSLQTVTVGSGVRTIKYEAFLDCHSLTSVSIADTVSIIGGNTFRNCWDLTEISFPESVTTIGDEAMAECSKLKKVIIPEDVVKLGQNIFYKSPNVTIYGVSGSLAEKYAEEHKIPFVNSIPAKPITVILYKDKENMATSGEKVYLWAHAYGGSGYFVYKFLCCDANNKNWKVLRDYGKSNMYTWTAEGLGEKHLYVDVKDDHGTVKRAEVVLEVKKAITASLSVSPSGSAVSGSKVKLTANASGGCGNYTYKFLVCDAKGNWYKFQDFSKSNTYTWTTGTTGKKTLYVDVKDSSGAVKRAGIAFEVKNKALTASLNASPSGSSVSGGKVKLTAGASGGSGNYTYKFLICDAKGNWYKLRDYSTENTYTWTTGAIGKKTLYVDVKDSQGTVKRASVSYEVRVALSVTFTTSPSGSAARGSRVTLTAKAGGGSGKYTYKFLICDDRGNWYKLRDYSADSSYIWTTGATGNKTLYVDVKDSNGTVKRASLSFKVR